MFIESEIIEIIADIFQEADIITRDEIVNLEINVQNERDRVSVLCREIRIKIKERIPYIRSLSISAEPIDSRQGDALFVFRYKDEIKIGLVEAKLLRINDCQNLNNNWDWRQGNTQSSHFTHQLKNHQQWINEMAVWCMFIPNCPDGSYSPPLIAKGSSNIWSSEMINHLRVNTPQILWSYYDILNLPVGYNYQNLSSIIKSILNCRKGIIKKITSEENKKFITIKSKNGKNTMRIPVPYFRPGSTWKKDLKEFTNEYNISSYNYYRFDDLVTVVKNYKKGKKIPRDKFKGDKEYHFFKQLVNKHIRY